MRTQARENQINHLTCVANNKQTVEGLEADLLVCNIKSMFRMILEIRLNALAEVSKDRANDLFVQADEYERRLDAWIAAKWNPPHAGDHRYINATSGDHHGLPEAA